VLLAACSSSSNTRPAPPALNEIPEEHKSAVSKEKTTSLVYTEYGETYKYTLGGKTGEYNYSNLPNGRSNLRIELSYQNTQGKAKELSGTQLVYQQPYSVITGTTWTAGSGDLENRDLHTFQSDQILGLATSAAEYGSLKIQNAVFDYTGVAFDGGNEQGTLNYKMDFGDRIGSGSITGFSRTGLITLQSATLENYAGDWSVDGYADIEKDSKEDFARYSLSFYGPKAEEVAGEVYETTPGGLLGESFIIFAGKR